MLRAADGCEEELINTLGQRFEGKVVSVEPVERVDLDMLNHLAGLRGRYLRVSFNTEKDMRIVLRELQKQGKQTASIAEIREFDLMYVARAMIDRRFRVAFWYNVVVARGLLVRIEARENMIEKPAFSVLAFDIETTKAPLKFPDPEVDCVMLISYLVDGEAFIIVNRDVVAADVQEFAYGPTPEIQTQVTVYNEANEQAALQKFFRHVRATKPLVLVTFNGDMFDWPFVMRRAAAHGISIEAELGLIESRGEIFGKHVFLHMDCFYWVQRDAFLPHGSHGLKAVTRAKLGYDPIELDPELMVRMAESDPQRLAQYSVSDSVATYHLYMKFINDFIFALCSIIPLAPDDVLRRGSGTLNEHLLMAEASRLDIIFPNKKREESEKFFKGHLIESETYVGGFVECLANGVYRSDVEQEFVLNPDTFEYLMENTENILNFCLQKENDKQPEEALNLAEVKEAIITKLNTLKQRGRNFMSRPLIYHVDVASMYPNIILTNRLQPTAIVNERVCSNCLFNEPRNNCKRILGWEWKAQYYPINKIDLEKLRMEVEAMQLKPAIKKFCQKQYKSVHTNVVEYRENTVCMRENPFYVDTIRAFRDRRNNFKALTKQYNKKADELLKQNQVARSLETRAIASLYDSRQLAHKIILNSFYGYVMKRGARWYSMEMAAMVTYIGSKII